MPRLLLALLAALIAPAGSSGREAVAGGAPPAGQCGLPAPACDVLARGVSDQPSLAAWEAQVARGVGPRGQEPTAPVPAALHTQPLHPERRARLVPTVEGVPCFLPFDYQGVTYSDCHPDGWCCLDPKCAKKSRCLGPTDPRAAESGGEEDEEADEPRYLGCFPAAGGPSSTLRGNFSQCGCEQLAAEGGSPYFGFAGPPAAGGEALCAAFDRRPASHPVDGHLCRGGAAAAPGDPYAAPSHFAVFATRGARYEGCFVNAGADAAAGFLGSLTAGECARLARQSAAAFFGMGGAVQAEGGGELTDAARAPCLPLGDRLPTMRRAPDCECRGGAGGRQLGAGGRLAVYALPQACKAAKRQVLPRSVPGWACTLPEGGGGFLRLASGCAGAAAAAADAAPAVGTSAAVGQDATVVFLLHEDGDTNDEAWSDDFAPLIDLALTCRLQADGGAATCTPSKSEVHFVWLAYYGDADSRSGLRRMKSRLESEVRLRSNASGAVAAALSRFHFVETPAWYVRRHDCWLPDVLRAWAELRGSLRVETTGGRSGKEGEVVLRRGTLGIRGKWGPAWETDANASTSGPLRWFGLACSEEAPNGTVLAWPEPSRSLNGSMALIARGECSFYSKALRAQRAGAVGVIIFSQDSGVIEMGCAPPDPCDAQPLKIITVMVDHDDGEALLGTLYPRWTASNKTDGASATDVRATLEPVRRGPAAVGLLAQGGGLRQMRNAAGGLRGIALETQGMLYESRVMSERVSIDGDASPDTLVLKAVDAKLLTQGFLSTPLKEELAEAIRAGGYDSLELELWLDCKDHLDEKCGPWDFEMNLFACGEDLNTTHPTRCANSWANVARWVTAYGKEGRWLSNATAALPLFQTPGKRPVTLHFTLTGWQEYEVTLYFLLRRHGPSSPLARGSALGRLPLWTGGPFNETYNRRQPTMNFTVPAGTQKAVLSTIITGHGWGTDKENCAEFCNHSHFFSVNGGEAFAQAFPLAGTSSGCESRVPEGAVPNQYGTWPFGRAGWCPGKHVDWWEADVTKTLRPGAVNNISYRALFLGHEYVPAPSDDPNNMGFPPELHVVSALTFYGEVQGRAPTLLL